MQIQSKTYFNIFTESPDLNPIENLWHEMKDYLRKKVKQSNEEELVRGILNFWDSVTTEKCITYINHLKKVLPEVISVNGEATKF